MDICPFCGLDPFHWVHNGLRHEAVAVVCCELGDMYFRGARPPITSDVILAPEEFRTLGQRIMGMMIELERFRERYGDIDELEPQTVEQ